jgi:hypothetical protein
VSGRAQAQIEYVRRRGDRAQVAVLDKLVKGTKIEPVEKDRYTMTGDLVIKGVTKPVTLDVVKLGEFNDRSRP